MKIALFLFAVFTVIFGCVVMPFFIVVILGVFCLLAVAFIVGEVLYQLFVKRRLEKLRRRDKMYFERENHFEPVKRNQ